MIKIGHQDFYIVVSNDNEIRVIPAINLKISQSHNLPVTFELTAEDNGRTYKREKKLKISEQEVAELFKFTDEELLLKE